jgi:hypothetical protein
MLFGMLNILQKWIFHFIKRREPRNRFNAIPRCVPAYHELTPRNKPYEEVSQSKGNEMKERSLYRLGVLTQAS